MVQQRSPRKATIIYDDHGVGGRALAPPRDVRWLWFVPSLARRHGARPRRVPLAAHRAAPPRVGRFARVNARLKLARVHSAQGRGLPTAAGRGRSHTARARADTDSNFHG